MILSDIERDAICELVNIGMGKAAKSLGKMVDDRVLLTIPALELVEHANVESLLDGRMGSAVTAIKERFSGAFQGDAILVFPETHSLELVRSLLDEDMPVESLTDLEQESLLEVGNIVLNSCLGTFTNILNCRLDIDLPVLCRGSIERIFGQRVTYENTIYMVMRIDFTTQKKMIKGYLVFLFDSEFTAAFLAQINKYVGLSQ